MCNLFSGHIVTDKESKDWGKVLFVTGVHHEKDREDPRVSKYGSNLLAWETKSKGTFNDGVEITHDCGQNLSNKEKNTLLELVAEWGKKQKRSNLVRHITESEDAYYFIRDCNPTKEEKDYLKGKGLIK